MQAYVGLMSGTSTDGVDCVLADLTNAQQPHIIASTSIGMPKDLRTQIISLNTPGNNELERSAIASNQLADLYAQAVQQTLKKASIDNAAIKAIGVHGQTVRHAPNNGYTIQLNAPARLAEQTGIAVIADFRTRDIAAQGQGAPLVPAFHKNIFKCEETTVVLNLGGMANITIINPNKNEVTGFDTGPANILLDSWAYKNINRPYDKDGAWALSGKTNSSLLDYLLESEPWLKLAPPKSTGRHLFNLKWLEKRFLEWSKANKPISEADVQATLIEFTALTALQPIFKYAADCREIIVCGGGALNKVLMSAINKLAEQQQQHIKVTTSLAYGIHPQLVEALAFAWLAYAWENNITANLPKVTGAKGPRILGCKYPA